MQGKATIAGHPLHPIFVTIPIGCFVAAVASDVISIWAGPPFWSLMATWLVGFGIVGALVAAFFGFVDYLSAPMSAKARAIAAWHMMVNLSAVVIFGVAFAVRLQNVGVSAAGYALTVLGLVVLGVGGALGGSVAHRHLVGSSEEDLRVTRRAADETSLEPVERVAREREIARASARRGTLEP